MGEAAASERRRGPLRHPLRHLAALALLALCGLLLWTSERGRSPTADEPLHLIRGHAYWWTGSAQLSFAHPPLANAITSLPQAGLGDAAWGPPRRPNGELRNPGAKVELISRAEVLVEHRGWEIANPLPLSTAYFRHDFERARAELRSARRMMMLWTLALAAFLYLWLERRYGVVAGLIGLALVSLHPTLLAHGRLATTDLPLAATCFASLAALIAWIERPSWARAGIYLLAATAMVLSKHSGLAFVVIHSLIVLGAAWLGLGGFAADARRARRTALVALQLLAVAALMIFAIAAAYRFDRVGLSVAEILAEPEPRSWVAKRHDYALLEHSFLGRLPPGLRLPFPYTWLAGLATVSEQNAMGHGRFFFGMRSSAGHPLYFPVLLFAKTPTGLLVLLAAAAGLVARRWRAGQRPSVATGVLVVFAAVNLASLCASNINIGVRHALSLVPLMIVFAARGAGLLWAGADLPRWLASWRARALVGACSLGCVLGAAWTFPAWLGDFNLLVGGPAGGHRISVIGEDWGQDLDDLADLAEQQGWTELAYFTPFPLRREVLEARGLEVDKFGCDEPQGGAKPVVLHISDLARRGERCFAWLGDREPAFVVRHHLLVYVDEDRR